jgi:lipoprotein NlpI
MKNDVLAEKHLAKAVELDPAMTEAYIYLAAIKVRGQDFKGAALVLNRGLILDPVHEIGNMMKRELNQLD